MSAPSDTPRFDPDQLSQLLSLCRERYDHEKDSDAGRTDREKESLLHDLLCDALPLSPDVIASLPVILQRLHREMPRREGRSLIALLQDPGTSLQDLRATKEYGKSKTAAAQTEAQYEAAGVVYYAAIAAALVLHNERISRHSYQQLRESFSSLNAKEWIVPELRQLFKRAGECCPGTTGAQHSATPEG
jgi:hypothetical protein